MRRYVILVIFTLCILCILLSCGVAIRLRYGSYGATPARERRSADRLVFAAGCRAIRPGPEGYTRMGRAGRFT